LYALGKCWKREGWIISMYQRIGDRYATVKIRKAEFPAQETGELKVCGEGLIGESGSV
jgi:hypothetical protein